MTDTEINELEKLAKAATPGPWTTRTTRNGSFVYSENGAEISFSSIIYSSEPSHCVSKDQAEKNASFIAAVNPITILYLIEELRKTSKKRDWIIRNVVEREGMCPLNVEICFDNTKTREDCIECWKKSTEKAAKKAAMKAAKKAASK